MRKKHSSSSSNRQYICVENYKGGLCIVELDLETGQRRYYRDTGFKPSLFFVTKDPSKAEMKSISGLPMKRKRFSIYEYKDFIKNIEESKNGLEKFVAGNVNPSLQYISEAYPDKIEFTKMNLRICYLDIETGPAYDGSFSDPKFAEGEILTIALKYNDIDKFIVLGMKDFDASNSPEIEYVKCSSEKHLLLTFLKLWTQRYPDIISGWFISTFDMPYIYQRICNVLGEEFAQKLSPFEAVYLKKDLDPINKNIYEDRQVLHIVGIQELDYVRLYKKFASRGETESNALNYIAELELGEKKVEYEGSLFRLYETDFQKFVEYNVHDVRLVEKLDEKLNLMFLAANLAYFSKTIFRDVFFQVRMWDAIIYNFLKKRGIIVPFSKRVGDSMRDSYEGAYVKSPLTGMKDWVVSFDVTSLYPHLILQFNISPDTYKKIDDIGTGYSVDMFLEKKIPEYVIESLKKHNVCLAANGATYTNEFTGFLPELIQILFEERKHYKKLYLENMNNYEKTKDEKYKETAKVYDILQNVKKICLNSAYGAMGNVYFRFYNIILASSVTLSGQLVIRYIEKICNEILNEKFGTSGVDYCIASDTDSVYLDYSPLKNKVKSVEDIDAFNKEVLRHIDKSLKDLAQYLNCRENKIFLKREVIADRGIFLAKKRYCLNVLNSEGIQYKEPKIKMMGVEAIKSSTPKICREILKNSIKTILQENNDKLIENLEKYREQFIQSSIYDIAFPRNVNNLEKYSLTSKSVPVHVRGALVFNKLIKDRKLMEIHPIISGDKIKFLYLKEPNPFESYVISFPANVTLPKEIIDDITKYVDYEKMIEKAVIDPLKILTEPINWKIERSFNLLDLFA